MKNDEAKFILSAFRPSGQDAGNPAFGDALRKSAEDPKLGEWFARSRAHDSAVSEKLCQIEPPAGLREAILAGARVSQSQRSGGRRLALVSGLAAAAAVAVVLLSMRAPVRADSGASSFAGFAINDMVKERHGGAGEPALALIAQLQAKGAPMPVAGGIDFDKLKATGCRTLSFAGHDVLEVCFARDGVEFHLYVARRATPAEEPAARGPSFFAQAAGAAAVWSDRQFDYAVASRAGIEAVRRLL